MTITHRPAKIEDAEILAPIMREQDRVEVYLSHGVSPKEALRLSFLNSDENYSMVDDEDKIIAMFGCVKQGDKAGMPWLLGSDDIANKNHHRSFLFLTKTYVQTLKERYDYLYNYAHAENTVSLKWLEWLGFSLGKKIKNWGLNSGTFIKFSWDRR